MLHMSEKKLGFGMMRLPLRWGGGQGDIDYDLVCKMVDRFLERGFTYVDTAWMYHSFQSEIAVRECLVKRHPRESYTLATKLHAGFFNTIEERDRVFEEQLAKTGVDYFDYYLIHDVERENYDKYEGLDCFRFAMGKKAEGRVRHVGFSFHADAEFLDYVLNRHPEMEFVQLQINYLDWESAYIQSRQCYEVAQRHGKPIVVMEPVKGGTLAHLPPQAEARLRERNPDISPASWAIRFAATLPQVAVVLSGMSDEGQMEDNMNHMEWFTPLNDEEMGFLLDVAETIRQSITVPCTACCYCVDGCPQNIPIPRYFAVYNSYMRESGGARDPQNWEDYRALAEQFGKPADCIACGQCEGICPQHLPIIQTLRTIADKYR